MSIVGIICSDEEMRVNPSSFNMVRLSNVFDLVNEIVDTCIYLRKQHLVRKQEARTRRTERKVEGVLKLNRTIIPRNIRIPLLLPALCSMVFNFIDFEIRRTHFG